MPIKVYNGQKLIRFVKTKLPANTIKKNPIDAEIMPWWYNKAITRAIINRIILSAVPYFFS